MHMQKSGLVQFTLTEDKATDLSTHFSDQVIGIAILSANLNKFYDFNPVFIKLKVVTYRVQYTLQCFMIVYLISHIFSAYTLSFCTGIKFMKLIISAFHHNRNNNNFQTLSLNVPRCPIF